MEPPVLPLGARAMNAFGRAARAVGLPLGRLDPEALIGRARDRAELDDFGDDAFRTGLEILIDSCEREAALTPLGRMMVQQEVERCLVQRLELHDWRKHHPELEQERVDRPIFIVGQGRTGTTILHELLTLDPNNRVPLTWEVESPTPPPETATYTTDPRIEEAQHQLDQSERLIPDFKRIHRMGGHLPQECVRFMAYEMVSAIFSVTWRTPTYTRFCIHDADMSKVYAAHRRFLQHLQSRHRGQRWMVKSPAHLWYLPHVVAEYPDARFIQTHRDPLKVLSSLTSLHVVLRKMASDDIDVTGIAQEWSEFLGLGYERSVDYRESTDLPADRFVDLQFREFLSDPIAGVRRIYDQFDMELAPDVAARMKDYVDSNPDDRDGRHVHHYSELGLDAGSEREKVKRYQEYFDVPSEKIT